ncbi:MerR family transcriptional regulator [Microbacterium sp. X-17]|uniref:MerR family transcriptional regulator n=1 Tax=Microbacterium sp. X-17 TaxID=3144404 RepID=UPI0031F48D7F
MTTDAGEYTIHQLARLTGTTSRTLRHYDSEGLLSPARLGANGYRFYGPDELVRLQRILLLRELGVGLPQIAEVLDRDGDEIAALETHLVWLRREQERLTRQIAAVGRTIEARRGGEHLMAEDMFDGFDHTQYREEVTQRWGAEAYRAGDRWWRGMTADDRTAWQQASAALQRDWADAAARGIAPDSDEARALAARHAAWLRSIPGTPAGEDFPGYLRGLGDLYVADPRFTRNYGDLTGAEFVRDALQDYAESL